MNSYTCWTLVMLFALSTLAFMHPVFLPCVVTSQSASYIIRAFAEIGLIVSVFMAFKFALLAVLPLVFCTSIIVSYSTLRALPDWSFEAQAIAMASLCLILNVLLALCVCCHMQRKIRNQFLSAQKGKGTNQVYCEFLAARSFSEYLTQNKSERSLLKEQVMFENFINDLLPRPRNAEQMDNEAQAEASSQAQGQEDTAPTARFY